ncbi:ABC efflux pump, inner membrane subunit [Candidatus Koribacter versatilis Ellin345]|uniref:ABC efflux pump, inner membrane subunit n=1 Tax=Koribacter versatilis (strain Ellin345) TaxID=204669 RepID=Q1IUM7_KORVE|nr:ABC transporter permease [Candidatus Koribacter versatilis]ABF39423.1 ABC efflux pump, inner membrane subunit [Candidatus Koribacter versatilis Ellin345]
MLAQEIRHGVRILQRSPGFAFATVLTLSICIGVNIAMFWIVDGVLLRPLPYRESDRLVNITTGSPERQITGIPTSWTKFQRMQQESKLLESVGAYFPTTLSISTNGVPEELPAAHATASLFQALDVTPAMGRSFLPQEEREGGAQVAIISDHFWRTRFNASSDILGKTISLDGRSVEVIGVLPRRFQFPFVQPAPEVWVPRVFEYPTVAPARVRSGAAFLSVHGRLKSGATIKQLQSELSTLARAYEADNPGFADGRGFTLEVVALKESVVGQIRSTLLTLLIAVGFLWLVGCSNIAGLLVARATTRRKEIAIRQAIGASRSRIATQLVAESLVLSYLAGIFGVVIALACGKGLRMLPPGTLPRVEELGLDPTVVLFAILLSTFATVVIGIIPAVQIYRPDIYTPLKEGGRTANTGQKGSRSRLVLVVGEVAAAMVLLAGAGMLIKSFANLARVHPGFDPQNVMTFTINLPTSHYNTPEKQREFYRALLEEARAIPGVDAAGVISALPIGGFGFSVYVCPEGTVCQGIGKDPVIAYRMVSPAYVKTLRIPLLAGRDFTDHDNLNGSLVTIINQSTAKKYFPNVDPIGRHLVPSRERIPLEIVGVIGDVRANGLGAPVSEEFYVPAAQASAATMTLVLRSHTNLSAFAPPVRRIMAKLDPDVPFANVATMNQVISDSVTQSRLTAILTGAFASIALFLTSVGIYGVIAYWVAERSYEIGLRLAVGAMRKDILTLVLKQGMSLVAIGLVIGLAGSLLLSRFLKEILFGIGTFDPRTLIETVVILSAVAVLAVLIPARRALSVDPIIVLR